ncbi:MAG: T9SS type A sorting domain-containing protein [bacterium]
MKYIVVILLILCKTNINGQWIPLNSTTTNFLTSIYFVDDTVGYFADESKYIYKTVDGGLNWNPSGDSLGRTVYFNSVDTGFTAYNNIYKTVDGGNTWTEVFQSTKYINSICFPSDGSIGYASGHSFDSAFVYKTLDGGNNWNLIADIPAGSVFFESTGITFTSPDTGYLCGAGIYKTVDGGMSWFLIYSHAGWEQICFPTTDTGYVVGLGSIAKTVDATNWTLLSLPFTNLFYNSLFFLSADTGYVAAGNGFNLGVILKTTDGGINWVIDLNAPYPFQSICFPSNETGYACGDNGEVYKKMSSSFISEINKNEFSFYPNPSSGKFNLEHEHLNFDIEKIEIYNNFGLLETKLYNNNELDLSLFGKGIYIAKIFTKSGYACKKLIVD